MDGSIQLLIQVVRDIDRTSSAGFSGEFKKDCTYLSSRVVLLSHLFKETIDFKGDVKLLNLSCLSELMVALQDAKKLWVREQWQGQCYRCYRNDGDRSRWVFLMVADGWRQWWRWVALWNEIGEDGVGGDTGDGENITEEEGDNGCGLGGVYFFRQK
ncbi:hypothetical protein Hanom_Chr04g00286481 [Helianthus anomalus]